MCAYSIAGISFDSIEDIQSYVNDIYKRQPLELDKWEITGHDFKFINDLYYRIPNEDKNSRRAEFKRVFLIKEIKGCDNNIEIVRHFDIEYKHSKKKILFNADEGLNKIMNPVKPYSDIRDLV